MAFPISFTVQNNNDFGPLRRGQISRGYQTDYVYNDRGQLTEQIEPADASGVRRKTIIEYAGPISRKEVVRVCGWHPTNSALTTCGTSKEIQTEYDYWGGTFLPAVERRKDPATLATRVTSYAYDSAGRLLSVDGPLAGTDDTAHFRYDTFGRKEWEVGEAASNGKRLAKKYVYRNSDDKVTEVRSGFVTSPTDTALVLQQRIITTYSSRREPIRERTYGGSTLSRTTDRAFLARGLLQCAAVRMNLAALPAASTTAACSAGTQGNDGPDRITRNVYDVSGQLVQVVEGLGTAIESAEATYSYTRNGKREYVIDANGNRARLEWDGFDRQSKWVFPSKIRPTAYNDSSQATALSSAGALNTADYEQYTYDANGNRLSLRKRDGLMTGPQRVVRLDC